MLKEIYLDPDAPQGNRIKAASAALPHESPRLAPVSPPLDLVAEPVIPLADLVAQRRARQNALEPPYRLGPDGHSIVLLKGNGGNGSDQS